MKNRTALSMLALLLAAAGAHAASEEASAPGAEPALEARPAQQAQPVAEAVCGEALPAALAADVQPAPGWHCDCNSNQDCDRICGKKGHTCQIYAVCSNWPDFTGVCDCPKVTPTETEPVEDPG